jgi:LysM repeat protein
MAQQTGCEFTYCIEPGDTYASIARRFSISARALQGANGGAALTPGHTIRIPCMQGRCRKGRFYTIRRNDTLLRIARRNNILVSALLDANPYLNPGYYIPGQVIVIPGRQPTPPKGRYTLRPDDGLVSVLKQFHMDITMLCALNPGLCPMDLRPGMTINVSHV